MKMTEEKDDEIEVLSYREAAAEIRKIFGNRFDLLPALLDAERDGSHTYPSYEEEYDADPRLVIEYSGKTVWHSCVTSNDTVDVDEGCFTLRILHDEKWREFEMDAEELTLAVINRR